MGPLIPLIQVLQRYASSPGAMNAYRQLSQPIAGGFSRLDPRTIFSSGNVIGAGAQNLVRPTADLVGRAPQNFKDVFLKNGGFTDLYQKALTNSSLSDPANADFLHRMLKTLEYQ